MAVDIMADSQTEVTLGVLDRGEADDAQRDRVLAALLRALTKACVELGEIKGNLWKPDDLKRYIGEQHTILCQNCPTRRAMEAHINDAHQQPQSKLPWILQLASNSSVQFFILLLFLIGAFIYLCTGQGGVNAAREAATTVLSGGAK